MCTANRDHGRWHNAGPLSFVLLVITMSILLFLLFTLASATSNLTCPHGICQERRPKLDKFQECRDLRTDCNLDECATSRFTRDHCPQTCEMCSDQSGWRKAKRRRPLVDHALVFDVVGRDLGVAQIVSLGNETAEIERARQYVSVLPDLNKKRCRNRSANCAFWAALGECTKGSRAYMITECAPVCETCHMSHTEARCPVDESVPHVWEPGDLQRTMERLEDRATTIVSRDPWLLTVDDFLTPDECRQLIELGHELGFAPSTEVMAVLDDGSVQNEATHGRTSETAWCRGDCYNKKVVQNLLGRVESLVQIPRQNYEYPQLLHYAKGAYYASHHDYIEYEQNRAQGVRILTVLLYLNEVERGGETGFPALGQAIVPTTGRLVIFPNVRNDDPNAKDPRSLHEALPTGSTKYAINLWVHQKDAITPVEMGC